MDERQKSNIGKFNDFFLETRKTDCKSNSEMVKFLREKSEEKGIILKEEVFEAMVNVDRKEFLPENAKNPYHTYSITFHNAGDYEVTCSAPYLHPVFSDYLNLDKTKKVLEIGTGCGYHACITSELAKEVVTMEFFPEVAEIGIKNIEKYKAIEGITKGNATEIGNITVITGDGSKGYEQEAKYDAIYFTTSVPEDFDKQALIDQLKPGGRIIYPTQPKNGERLGELVLWENGQEYEICKVRFIRLRTTE